MGALRVDLTRLLGIVISPGEAAQGYSDVLDLRCPIIRHGMRWTTAESVQGTYDWTEHDATVAKATSANLKLLGILSDAPTWARSIAGNPNGPITGFETNFYNYVSSIVSRYAGRIDSWEVWHEPQLNGWSAASYASFLISTSQVIRATDPSTRVVGFALNGTFVDNDSTHDSWALQVLQTPGVMAACDAISIHVYCQPADPYTGDSRGPIPNRMTDTKNLLSSNGYHGPVWVTEGGWPTTGGTAGQVTEAQQATYVSELIDILSYHVDRYYVFQLYPDASGNEVSGMSIIRSDNTHKPAYDQVKARNGRLYDASTAIPPPPLPPSQPPPPSGTGVPATPPPPSAPPPGH